MYVDILDNYGTGTAMSMDPTSIPRVHSSVIEKISFCIFSLILEK